MPRGMVPLASVRNEPHMICSTRYRWTMQLAALLLVGCATVWQPVDPAMLGSGASQTYRRVLLMTRDGFERQLTDVVVMRDSVFGTRADSAGPTVAIALADVAHMESAGPESRAALAAVAGFAHDVLVEMGSLAGQFVRCIFGRRC
jgi:hypothetical protein